jgi:hypothetical protein
LAIDAFLCQNSAVKDDRFHRRLRLMKTAGDLRVLQGNSDPPHEDGQRPSLRDAGEGSTSLGGKFFSSNESKQSTSLALLPIDEKSLIFIESRSEPSWR